MPFWLQPLGKLGRCENRVAVAQRQQVRIPGGEALRLAGDQRCQHEIILGTLVSRTTLIYGGAVSWRHVRLRR